MNNATAEARLEEALDQVRDLAWNVEGDHDGITHSTDHDGNHILATNRERIMFCLDTTETISASGTLLDWGYTWTFYTADIDAHGDQIGWDCDETGGSDDFADLAAAVTNWAKYATGTYVTQLTGDADSDTICDELNNYCGDNLWQEVIIPLGIDDDVTDELDQGCAEMFVLEDGRLFRWVPGQFGGWEQQER